MLAHLLKYDSILGNLKADIRSSGDRITVDGDEFQVLAQKDLAALPWKDLGVEMVFEATGRFTKRTMWPNISPPAPNAWSSQRPQRDRTSPS